MATPLPAAAPRASIIEKTLNTYWVPKKEKFNIPEEFIPRFSKYPETAVALRALLTLGKEDKFSSTVIGSYLDVVESENMSHFYYRVEGVTFIDNRRTPFEIAELINDHIKTNPYLSHFAIPYVINEHHVVIYIVKDRYVAYYDPYGIPPTPDMKEQLDKIRYLFRVGNPTVVNLIEHQKDYYRCGAWGSLCISRLAKMVPPEEFFAEVYSGEQLDDFVVNTMAKKIYEKAVTALLDHEAEEAN